MRRAVLSLALLPGLASAQGVSLRVAGASESGTVLGRVCRDLDGDGRCSDGEPGVPQASLLLDTGQVALTDEQGRYHVFAVPARVVEPGRSAYGGHAIALESGPSEARIRRGFELAPGGVARVDLAVPLPGPVAFPALLPGTWSPADAPRFLPDGKLEVTLSGRAPVGSEVSVAGRTVKVDGDGSYATRVALAPRENGFGLAVVTRDGTVAFFEQLVYRVPRTDAGDLVVPRPPSPIAALRLPAGLAAAGQGIEIRGTMVPGARLRVDEQVVEPLPSGQVEVRLAADAAVKALLIEAASPDGTRAELIREVAVLRRGGAIAGVLDGEVSFLGNPRVLATGRGAVAVRGTLGPLSGEAGIDLDDRDRSGAALLAPRDPLALERQLAPGRDYVVGGDDGAAGDANAARGRLWARGSAGPVKAEVGSTRPGSTTMEIGRYDRALFGARLGVDEKLGPVRVEAMGFGSRGGADPAAPAARAAHDELQLTGGSLYYLRHRELVAGSEALRLERRDPFTGLLVETRVLRRGVDYEIDFFGGRVLLARPVASVGSAALAAGDPLLGAQGILFADYSYASLDGGREDVRGGRAALEAFGARLEGGYAAEDRPGESFRLASAAAGFRSAPLTVRAEVAQSEGGTAAVARSSDGGLGFADDPQTAVYSRTAMQAEARGEALGFRYAGWWREREQGFADSARLETQAARERGGEASWRGFGAEVGALYAERRGADLRDPEGRAGIDARRFRGRAGYALGDWKATAEVLREEVAAADGTGTQLAAGLRADYALSPLVGLDASHLQSLSHAGSGPAGRDATFSAVGATLHGETGDLSARAGWGPALGPRILLGGERHGLSDTTYGTFTLDPDAPSLASQTAGALGARSRDGASEAFIEDQFARDPFGLRAGRVAGLAVAPSSAWRLVLSGESGSRLRLDGSTVGRSAIGATASYQFGTLHAFARGELRLEGADRQWVGGAAAEWRPLQRLTLGGRVSVGDSAFASAHAFFLDGSLGAAWRGEGVLWLVKAGRLVDDPPGAARRTAWLASAATTIDVGRRFAVGCAANLGLRELAGAPSDLVSASARALVRITGPFDAALEAARRAVLSGPSPDALNAARLEAGWAVGEGRLAIGYNFLGFTGTGVDPTEQQQGRVYLRAELVY